MDTSTLLEQYTQDLSNLPSEITYLLQELRDHDLKLLETRRRLLTRDSQIHKYIRTNGSLAKNPKEAPLAAKIREDFAACRKIQAEKQVIANTALFLVSKHLALLDADMERLEREGLLAPDESELRSRTPADELRMLSRVPPRVVAARKSRTQTPQPARRFKKEEDGVFVRGGMPHEGEDETLYCFCRQVSYGDMIGCDNDDCKFEWFHYDCVGVTEPSKEGELWYCPDCRERKGRRGRK